MNDSELEHLLRRYRPGNPPPGLRERILSPPEPRRVWPWAAAAAILLVSALTSRMAAQREAGRIDLGADPSVTVIAQLTDALGGDADARATAESIVIEARLRSELAAPPTEPEREQR